MPGCYALRVQADLPQHIEVSTLLCATNELALLGGRSACLDGLRVVVGFVAWAEPGRTAAGHPGQQQYKLASDGRLMAAQLPPAAFYVGTSQRGVTLCRVNRCASAGGLCMPALLGVSLKER